jgi:ribosomal protein S18 acetylase RimI-like enzyme
VREGPEIRVRPLRASDLDRIFSARSRPSGERWLDRQAVGAMAVAVAELDREPVGRVCLDFVELAGLGAARLYAAHVEPPFQSRGIGSALIAHVERLALEHGFATVRLEVEKTNQRARSLYERLGYAVVGEQVNRWSYREDGRVVKVVEDCWTLEKSV